MLFCVWSQAVLLGVYADGMQPSEAATVTETLGNYLKTFGYWSYWSICCTSAVLSLLTNKFLCIIHGFCVLYFN